MSAAFSAPVTSTHVWDSTRNEYVSSDHLRFAQLLAQYDPRYSLEYVPANDRVNASPDELMKPYRIVERTAQHGRQVIRYLSAKDMDDPAQVLAWIFEGDLSKHRPNDVINKIELRERAERLMNLKRREEEAQERQDLIAYGVSGGRDQRNYIRLGKNLKIAR